MKKQITLALMLTVSSGMVTNQLAGLNSYHVAAWSEGLNTLAQVNRIFGMTSTSETRIKINSAIACFSELLTLLAQGYKGGNEFESYLVDFQEKRGFDMLMDGDYLFKNLFGMINSIRMYRNAKDLAFSNKKGRSFLKTKTILILSILASKGTKCLQDFAVGNAKNCPPRRGIHKIDAKKTWGDLAYLLIPANLLTACGAAFYEHGLYDGLNKALDDE